MANGEIYEKNLSNASGIGSGDYLRTVNSSNESEKINYTLLAQAIIEQWAGSTLAGSAQSVKSAIDTLDAVMNDVPYTTNKKLKYIANIDDFNHITNEWVLTRSTTNAPVASTYFYVLTFAETRDSSGYVTTGKQIAFSYITDSEDTYIRHGRNGTWGTWQKVPTRAEIDALLTPQTTTLTALGKTWYFYKLGRIVTVMAYNDMNSAVQGTNDIGTLPEAFRPIRTVYLRIQNSAVNMFLSIYSTGAVNFYSDRAVSSAMNCGIGGSYITAS